VFRGTWGSSKVSQGFAYGAITHYGQPFQTVQLPFINPMLRPRNPRNTEVCLVWANPRSLAATDGITIVFFSCGYLDVSVPRVRFMQLCIHCTMTEHYLCRVSPFGYPRIKARLTAPRGFSQFTASFIASLCLGIHRTPLVA
jgi:hypothetical protein